MLEVARGWFFSWDGRGRPPQEGDLWAETRMTRRSKDLEEEHPKWRGQLVARAVRLEQARLACQGAAGMSGGERGWSRLAKARTTHGSITQTKDQPREQRPGLVAFQILRRKVNTVHIPEYFITLFQCSSDTTPNILLEPSQRPWVKCSRLAWTRPGLCSASSLPRTSLLKGGHLP